MGGDRAVKNAFHSAGNPIMGYIDPEDAFRAFWRWKGYCRIMEKTKNIISEGVFLSL